MNYLTEKRKGKGLRERIVAKSLVLPVNDMAATLIFFFTFYCLLSDLLCWLKQQPVLIVSCPVQSICSP